MSTVITVANLKGGSGKTTTSVFLAQALTDAGLSVLIVDADPQGSTLRWADAAGWEMATVGLPVRTLHSQLAGLATEKDVVIIDTPPLEIQSGIVHSALRAADVVIVPTAPTPMEIERVSAVRDAIQEIASLRPQGTAPLAAVLLTRTVANAASTAVWRASLESDGWTVLKTEVRRLEAIAQAAGDRITRTGPYEDVAAEVLDLALSTQETSA